MRTAWLRRVAGGWQLSTILSAVSGEPLTACSGRDNPLIRIGNDTADVVGDWPLTVDRSKADKILKWFNTAAFVPSATGTFGYGQNVWDDAEMLARPHLSGAPTSRLHLFTKRRTLWRCASGCSSVKNFSGGTT